MKKNSWISNAKKQVMDILLTDDVFWKNEVEANLLLEKILIFSAAILVVTNLLNVVGVYKIPPVYLQAITVQGLLELLIPAALCHYYKGQKRWLKWLMMIMLTFVYARVYTAISYRTAILMVLPVLISCRYYSRKLTEIVAFVTTIVFFLAAIFSKSLGSVDMNTVMTVSAQEVSVPVKIILMRSFLPSYILFWISTIVSFNIAYRGRKMILEQDEIARNQSRVETELSMARQIQNRALPLIPELKKYSEYDLAAIMETAKEVGGDFYDFVYIDQTHLAIVIADVTGKGVPAALFMMVSKILLDNRIMLGGSPGQILKDVNNQICEKEMEDMFVTVWLAIVDLTNGHVTTANAGHEYPIICRKGGDFEVFKDKHGLVLGAFPGRSYPESEFDLMPGDKIYVYTDGVPEANNRSNELFTVAKTVKALNHHKDEDVETLLHSMKKELDQHADGSEQFDDITMIGFEFNHYTEKE